MVKDDQDVIAEFNEYVNMTASELEKWLESDESSEAGWRKDGGDGKSVGQDSGEKIIEILKSNPKKDPEKYTEDQIQHMRKVAAYCKRHLAQESGSLESKDPEEAKKTKSYISLKNWGHDPLKSQGGSKSSGKNGSKSSSKDKYDEAENNDQEEDGDEDEGKNGEKAEEDDKKAGDKRKKSGQQNGSNKKRETRQGASSKKNGEDGADQDEDENAEDDEENGDQEEEDGGDESSGKKPSKNGPKKGETVSWNWGSGNPEGKVLDVKEDE